MTAFTPIDLSKLAPPEVIETVAYEELFDAMKAEAIRLLPSLEVALSLDSEPVTQLLRVCAYFRMLDRLEFNDGARANMLAFATGSDLDHLAALWGVQRLVIQEADATVEPPIAQIFESDTDLRSRVQLSLEGRTTAGPRGSYLYWARSASGDVLDASVDSPAPGEVVVTILSREGDGSPSDALMNAVEAVLSDDDVRPLTDRVTVEPAQIVPYQVEATLTLYDGPDASAVEQAADAALALYIEAQHQLGHDVTRAGLTAALFQEGVQNVLLTQPATDVVIAPNQAPHCTSDAVAISIGGRDV